MSIINDDKELCVKLKPKQKNLSISNRFSIFFLERLRLNANSGTKSQQK